MSKIKALQPEQLRSRCNPESFQFRTTDDLPDLGEMVGQERALAALRFGVNMPGSGYNLYALGPAGSGKHTAVSHFLKEKATGSVNQHGQVPASNMKHLMLRRNVVDAVRENKFSIYAIDHADQAIELLTGITAGEADSDGIFPDDSANGHVQLRLRTLAGLRMQYTSAVKELTTSVSPENREHHGIGFSKKPGHNTD